MKYVLDKAYVFDRDRFERRSVLISDGQLEKAPENLPHSRDTHLFESNNCYVFPGLVDVHVHLREPGFSYKETIATGTLAAARGGYTAVCAMPNLKPPPDSLDTLRAEEEIIKRTAVVPVYPYGTITKGELGDELSEMEAMSERVCAFSDDGRGVQSDEMMEKAMRKAACLGKLIVAHCEDNTLLFGGYIHDGAYARAHGHRGISSESEWRQLERDLKLVAKTGCKYHMCHMSTKESAALMRQAKAAGLDVTCESAPHYLALCDEDIKEDGRFKMNPPLRSRADMEALREALCDGTIDMIATDHAPHSFEEKSRGLENSLMGVVGLECAMSVVYTSLVRTGIITMEKMAQLMSIAPRERFGLGSAGGRGDFTVFDFDDEYEIEPSSFASLGRSTPFDKMRVRGKCIMTVAGGKTVWNSTEK